MAYSEGTEVITELAGEFIAGYVDVSPDAATGNFTLDDYDELYVMGVTFIEDLASTCLAVSAKENSTTENQIDVKLWGQGGSAATTFPDFRPPGVHRKKVVSRFPDFPKIILSFLRDFGA